MREVGEAWDQEKFGQGGVGTNAVNLSLLPLMSKPLASFRRKPKKGLFKLFWTPPFAGVTVFGDGISLKLTELGRTELGFGIQTE
jgi:hypothetical protein